MDSRKGLIELGWMGNVASWEELIKLELRVNELETAFRHYHVASGNCDICKQCGLDIRDSIHKRERI